MAPDENDPRLEVPIFRLELATVYCKRFDMYFTARNITLNEDKMNLLLHNADQETTELILENPDYYYRVTWRQFKLRIKKLLKEKNLKTMIICKQKEEETSTWLEKMVKLASRGDIDEDLAKIIIAENSKDFETRIWINNYIYHEKLYDNFDSILKNFKQEEIMREDLRREIENKHYMIKKKNIESIKITQRVEKEQEGIKEKKIVMNQLCQEEKNTDPRLKIIRINGNDMNGFLDTGSDVNIIDDRIILEKALTREKCESIQLNNIFGKIATLSECCYVTVQFDDVILTEKFYIAQLETEGIDLLIGNPLIEEIKTKKEEMTKLKFKFVKLFDEERSEGYEGRMCEFKTPPGKKVQIKSRKINQSMMEGATKTINRMLELGYIEPSTSSWCNPLKPVLKPDGSVRITSNLQFLNNLVESNKYTIQYIHTIIEKTQGKRYFTVVDLKDAYFQIKIVPEYKYKTAFYFNNKLFSILKCLKGLKTHRQYFR
jgi:hypothetical protein